jgi:hypothetical protein
MLEISCIRGLRAIDYFPNAKLIVLTDGVKRNFPDVRS